MKKMKVLIIGSLPTDKKSEEKERYREACRDIGKKLADSGWPIGIGTFNADTADALIIEGAAKSDRNIKVKVYSRREEYDPFAAKIQCGEFQAQSLKFEIQPVKGTWKTGRIEQIRESDIVFLIGGADKTAPAFIVAHLLKKPCLPIPGFGGASEEQWDEFSTRAARRRLDPEKDLAQRTIPWRGDDSASAVLNFAKRYVDSRPYPGNGRFIGLVLALAAFATLIWMILFFGASPTRGWAIFGILATTSVMGAALYWLVLGLVGRDDTQENARLFFIRIGAAIIEASMLFLLLLVSTGFISGNASILDSLSDRGVFGRFAIIACIFGFASGFLTEAVSKSLQTRLLKQISANDNERADQKP